MKRSTRLISARILAALAIVSLPGFIWLGWWQLLVSIVLSAAAAIIAPDVDDGPFNSSHRSRVYRNLRKRLATQKGRRPER